MSKALQSQYVIPSIWSLLSPSLAFIPMNGTSIQITALCRNKSHTLDTICFTSQIQSITKSWSLVSFISQLPFLARPKPSSNLFLYWTIDVDSSISLYTAPPVNTSPSWHPLISQAILLTFSRASQCTWSWFDLSLSNLILYHAGSFPLSFSSQNDSLSTYSLTYVDADEWLSP